MALRAGGHRPPGLSPPAPDTDPPLASPIPPEAARDAFDDGLAAYVDGDPATATDSLERALALDPTFDEARYILALIHQDAGRLDSALAELDAVLASTADDAPRLALRDTARRLRELVALGLRRARS